MTGGNENRLEQAYALIQQEKLDKAITILQPVLLRDPKNVDAWWLLANAVDEPDEAREALQKVLELDPGHAEARQLLSSLNELYPLPVEEVAEEEPSSFFFGETVDVDELLADTDVQTTVDLSDAEVMELVEAPPEVLPPIGDGIELKDLDMAAEGGTPALDLGDFLAGEGELPSFDDELPDFGEQVEEEGEAELAEARPRRRSVLRLLLIVVLLVAVVLAGVVLITLNRPATSPAPAQTEEALAPSDAMKTVLEAVESAANAQSVALGGTATAHLEARENGAALVIQVCRPADVDLSTAMGVAMEIAARYSVSVQNEIGVVGADLVNCARNDVLLRAVAPVDSAVAFANGSLSADDFRSTWQWLP